MSMKMFSLFNIVSGYPFRKRMLSNICWCFSEVECVEHLSLIRLHSL